MTLEVAWPSTGTPGEGRNALATSKAHEHRRLRGLHIGARHLAAAVDAAGRHASSL